MTEQLQVLNYVVSLAFVLLGVLTLRDYLRHPDRSRGFLAMAIGLLTVTNLLGLAQTLSGNSLGVVGQDIAVLVFLASGYSLLLFRGSFIPLSPAAQWVALALIVIAAGAYVVVNAGANTAHPTSLQAAITLFLILVWSTCVGEPIVRFWLASTGRPAVQRGRLRSLAIGYGALVAILVFAGVASSGARLPIVQLLLDLVVLLVLPFLYVSFAPPRWLRREWMYPEEQAYRDAVRELLLFSPTRQRLAERALDWAIRFVGADAGFIADSDGSVLAAKGMDEGQAERLNSQLGGVPETEAMRSIPGTEPQTAVVVPLPLHTGTGVLAVVSGPFTPFFGTEEVGRLAGYATNVTAGLDRAVLTERIASLERTKTEFLNLASHELRGPITVIRGYLSMLERGSLGDIPAAARQALPVLTAKADEMNLLVEQMIEAARLEEGRLELSPRRADLREVARTALEMASPFADSAHALVLESADIEVPVMVDVDRIATVVGNLLSNAIKYSPDGGRVILSVSTEDQVGKISVTDTGVGIPPDRLDRLFTRFGRIVTPETSHIPGTGLGLYLSRELARLHGGDITATSVLGRGSTFVLAVPLSQE